MIPAPIRVRLTLWYFAIFSLTFVGYAAGVLVAVRDGVVAAVDEELRTRLAGVQSFMERHDPAVSVEILQDEFREHSGLRPGGDLVQVSEADGAMLFQSRSIRPYHLAALSVAPSEPTYETIALEGSRVRVLSARVIVAGRTYAAQLAAPVDDAYALLRQFEWLLLAPIPVVLLLASAGGYFMSRRALAPVDGMTTAARSITEHNLSQRLSIPKASDELHRLAETFNQMLDRLEAAFTRITRFTADASHELRTPVAVIRTTAELALRQPRGAEDYRDAIGQILDESERMTALIDSLMTLARVDSGAEALRFTTVDLASVIHQVYSRSRPLAAAKHVHFDATVPDTPVWVNADEHALERLIVILVDNAIRYTPRDGRIMVGLTNQHGEAAVSVADTGVGIPAEAVPFIFERFYRVDQARSRRDGGAGLGLSIARWIADKHHAAIDVDSRPGQGSKFVVRMPSIANSRTEATA